MPDFPSCFESEAQYQGWRTYALRVKEAASVCTDCTSEYRTQMRQAGRCDPVKAQRVFAVRPSKGSK